MNASESRKDPHVAVPHAFCPGGPDGDVVVPCALCLEGTNRKTAAGTLVCGTSTHHNQLEEVCSIASFFLRPGILDCHFL